MGQSSPLRCLCAGHRWGCGVVVRGPHLYRRLRQGLLRRACPDRALHRKPRPARGSGALPSHRYCPASAGGRDRLTRDVYWGAGRCRAPQSTHCLHFSRAPVHHRGGGRGGSRVCVAHGNFSFSNWLRHCPHKMSAVPRQGYSLAAAAQAPMRRPLGDVQISAPVHWPGRWLWGQGVLPGGVSQRPQCTYIGGWGGESRQVNFAGVNFAGPAKGMQTGIAN